MDHQPHDDDLEKFGAFRGREGLTPGEVLDVVIETLPAGSPLRVELIALREAIVDQEQMVSKRAR